MKTYTPTIGIEVHTELKTKTKMFCTSKNDPRCAEPNQHVCPVCMGHPGTLPVINREAVRQVLMVGVATNGTIASYTEFDRKNYFYPDIPKGYQISQYAFPLVTGGSLAGVQITRVHLEEDTARSLHDQGEGSIVDFNRAGVPLMELVTEPVIHDAKTAAHFAKELQLLLRTLGVSSADMEHGEMRVEANVSISADNSLGTKVEIKNLNSFRAVEQAILYEVRRQAELLEQGSKVIQETRGWDESKGKTFSQRVKETSTDYRYFPDPDIPKLDISMIPDLQVTRLSENLPDLPDMKRSKYSDIGLSREQTEVIIGDTTLDSFYANCVSAESDSAILRLAANYITSDVVSLLEGRNDHPILFPGPFLKLMALLNSQKINSRIAKDILEDVVLRSTDPAEIVKSRGLEQIDSQDELSSIVDSILESNPDVVQEVRDGKQSGLQFLIGQGMKISHGKANPQKLHDVLKSRLER